MIKETLHVIELEMKLIAERALRLKKVEEALRTLGLREAAESMRSTRESIDNHLGQIKTAIKRDLQLEKERNNDE